MQLHSMRKVLLHWVPVALGLAVLTGCVAVRVQRAIVHPSSVVTSPLAGTTGTVVRAGSADPHRILIVGASYTQGLGAEPATRGYAYLVGPMLGWPSEVHGIAGTGYLNPGPRQQGTFAEQIARLPASFDPGVLLIQGGRNDGAYPQARLEQAINATIGLAHRHFRNARIVLLGCIPPRTPVDPGELRAEAALGHVAHTDKIAFIDPLREHWITVANAPGFAGRVPGHPNNAGYAYIADRVTRDLGALLHVRVTPSATRTA